MKIVREVAVERAGGIEGMRLAGRQRKEGWNKMGDLDFGRRILHKEVRR